MSRGLGDVYKRQFHVLSVWRRGGFNLIMEATKAKGKVHRIMCTSKDKIMITSRIPLSSIPLASTEKRR